MKLSVLVITYNHEKFIKQALDSILMQEVDFKYEIVIGEDFSTDKTREIVCEYKKSYPDKIKLLLDKKNIGACQNFIKTYEKCTGEYIAYLDGDDYWSSPDKLQKQIVFLDNNPGCAICCHAVQVVSEHDLSKDYELRIPGGRSIFTLRDLLDGNFIPNCTMMFRKGLFRNFPDWYFSQSQGDWSLHLLNAQHGDIGYLDEVMAAYRTHASGVWTGMTSTEREESIIATYEAFNGHLEFRYDSVICYWMAVHYLELLARYEEVGDPENFNRTVQRARVVIFRSWGGRFFIIVLLWLRCYAPTLFRILRRLKAALFSHRLTCSNDN